MRRILPAILATFAFIIAAVSCEKTPILEISGPTSLIINNNGDSKTFSFTTNRAWGISSSESWCKVSPASGIASDAPVSVTVTCDPNTTYDVRTCTITVRADELVQTLSVTQETGIGLIVSQNSYSLSNEAQSIEVEVKTNVKYNVSIDTEGAKWITNAGTKGLSLEKIVFNIAANDTYDSRQGKITISQSDGNLSETITVTQGEGDGLVIGITSYNLTNQSQTLNVEVKTNVDYTVTPSVSWIKYVETKGLRTSTVVLSIEANETYGPREGTVTIKQNDGPLSGTITIKQGQTDGIFITTPEYDLSNSSHTLSVEVQANVEYTITPKVDWIQYVQTKALESSVITLTISANEDYDAREGTVEVTQVNGDLAGTITVRQAESFGLLVTKETENISNESQDVEVEVKYNVDFDIIIPDEEKVMIKTIRYDGDGVETKALTTRKYIFTVYENTTYDSREASITFKQRDGSLSGTFTIIQAQKNSLLVTPHEFVVSNKGDVLSIEVRSNVDFKSSISDSAQSWIIPIETKGLALSTICFQVKENQEAQAREGTISFSSILGTEVVKVLQEAKPTQKEFPLERNALTRLYELTDGENWTVNDNWCTEEPLSEWFGITTNDEGRVESIELSHNELNGTIPDEISNLSDLKLFDVNSNNIFAFPESITQCRKLEVLNLGNNGKIEGGIPESIGNLTSLISLNLLGNLRMHGTIPNSLYNLPCWKYSFCDFLRATGGFDFSSDSFVAPAFDLYAEDGTRLNSDQIYNSHKYTILFSGILRDYPYVLPELLRLYDEQGDDIEIIAFYNEDESKYQIKDFKENNGIKWPCVLVNRETEFSGYSGFYSYGSRYFGDTRLVVIVNQQGEVVYTNLEKKNDIPESAYNFVTGSQDYESTDYSMNKKVVALQTATKGNGIDVVLLGDWYTDKLINDGSYLEDMKKARDAFFGIEPYKSFKEFFNVYVVFAVSKNSSYVPEKGLETAFKVGLRGASDFYCDGHDSIDEYTEIAIGPERRKSATVITIINSYLGRSYCTGFGDDYSCSFCSIQDLSYVVQHEACGHGFGKLADEYIDLGIGSYGDLDFTDAHKRWQYRNIDTVDNPEEIVWKHFLNDSRYKNEVGIYEGGYYRQYGVFRASEYSIMSGGGCFNAPSREEIYYRIHKKAYGDEWEYDFEKFAEYDAINREQTKLNGASPARKTRDISVLTAPPVYLHDK